VLTGGVKSGRLYDALAVAPRGDISARRLADLDTIRAVAALLVVVNHTTLMGGPYYAQGNLSPGSLVLNGSGSGGVSLFFVLSGFLIAGPFLRTLLDGELAPDTRKYLMRRATRIFPAYWVALLAVVLLIPQPNGIEWWQIPLHAVLLQSLVPGQTELLLVVAWSLCIELAFYVFVPIAAAVVRRFRSTGIDINALAAGVLALWVASLVWSIVVSILFPDPTGGAGQVLRFALPKTIARFLPGLLVFLALTQEAANRGGAWALYRRVVRRPWLPLALAFAAWLGGSLAHQSPWLVVNDLGIYLFAIAGGFVLATACQGLSWMAPVVRVLAPIGVISYGIYLWHWIAISTLIRNDAVPAPGSGPVRYFAHLIVAVGITLVLGLASWLLIERPFLRRGRVSAPPRPTPIAPAAASRM
jgi:peptidoglycan/LPS O-acetylase OafA/YrhL